MVNIKLKGREIPLLYTVLEMKTIQEEIAPLADIRYIITGQNPDDEKDMSNYGGVRQLEALTKMIRIMGNAGLEESGKEADLEDRKLMRTIRPGEIVNLISACLEAMNEGMSSEIPDETKQGKVDVVLEEIERKKEQAG